MRDRVVWLAPALLIALIAATPSQAQVNLLPNGSFDNGQMAPYGIYGAGTGTVVTDLAGAAVPEKPVDGKYCLHVVVAAAGANNWDVGMSDGSYTFKQGKKYTFSAFVKSKSGTVQFRLKPERAADPYEGYGDQVFTATEKWQEFYVTTPVIAADVTPASATFHFAFTAGDFWIDCVKLYEGDYVKTVIGTRMTADEPSPGDKATDVPSDVTLSWKAAKSAATHNVYLGTAFADVNTADLSKAVSKGQAGTTFKPAAPLEYGKTYYWRIDEVNAAPSNTVFKGDVWSFTVEPYAYPIPAASITATASSQDKSTTGPANTINGSGLTNDLHSTSSTAMWATSMTGTAPAWIQYQFNKAYKLQELWVWNHNTEMEPVLGIGFKDVTIEYSLDGKAWTLLKDTQFAQATALPGYAHNTTVDMGGVMAQYVRLTAKSNYSIVGLKQYGLSEVRFYYVPVQARAPQPALNDRGVSVSTSLDWRQGRDVTSQKVYLGTDKAAVTNGTATANTVTNHGFVPGALNFGTTYYWKVDEVGTATYPGEVWKFITQEYAAVDDFESYTDKAGAEVFTAWVDGVTTGLSNSVVGLATSVNGTFCDTTTFHGGKMSMPLEYNNVKAPYYSEAQRTFDTPQDWTVSSATTLSLWIKGFAVAMAETASGVTLSGGGADIYQGTAQFRYAYKQLTGDGSITVRVDSAQTVSNWTKAGVMMRATLDPLAQQVHMISAPQQSLVEWMYRSAANSTTTTAFNTPANSNKLPVWLRLTRAGNVFTGECSADGKTWTKITSGANSSTTTITMPATVCVGFLVCAQSTSAVASATFSQISTTGNVAGSWQAAAVGIAMPTNGPAPMYLTVEDKAGKKKTVVNPNPAATTTAAWTQWQIPLSDLTGISLAAVKKVTLGVGDTTNPKAGAAGRLFIDDLAFGKPYVPDATNYAANGSFETGALAPWGAWGGGGQTVTAAVVKDLTGAAVAEGPVDGSYVLSLKVSGPSTNFWDCAFNVAAPTFAKGTKYTLSAFFKVKSGTGKVNMKPEHSAPNWEGYGEKQVTVTDKWVEYYVTTPVFATDVSPASLTFHIGFQAQELWVDNVKFYEGDYVPTK